MAHFFAPEGSCIGSGSGGVGGGDGILKGGGPGWFTPVKPVNILQDKR